MEQYSEVFVGIDVAKTRNAIAVALEALQVRSRMLAFAIWRVEVGGGGRALIIMGPAVADRLPGFPNLKYEPPPLVLVEEDDGPTHTTTSLMTLAVEHQKAFKGPKSDAVEAGFVGPKTARLVLRRLGRRPDSNALSRIHQREVCGPFRLRFGGKLYTYKGDNRST